MTQKQIDKILNDGGEIIKIYGEKDIRHYIKARCETFELSEKQFIKTIKLNKYEFVINWNPSTRMCIYKLNKIKIKYRDHRGSLDESMKTVKEFYTIEELKKHLDKPYKKLGKRVVEIKFTHVGFDDRIGWDTYYVLIRFDGETDFMIAGMSDNILNFTTHKLKP